MSRTFRALITITAALLAMAGLGVNPASAATDVYTTPGYHTVNGRDWHTTCERYSSTVERCRAEIWATVITRTGNTYQQSNGWAFNNLTYLAAPRADWVGNPLTRAGLNSLDGREWRVECDTPNTGRNGCRAYIWSTMYTRTGNTYQTINGWQFNNVVLFSTPAAPGTTLYQQWVNVNARISSSDDLTIGLQGLPTPFQNYMAGQLASIQPIRPGCGGSAVIVDRYHGAGYAYGAMAGCGGYQVIWGIRDGHWTELTGGQDIHPCSELDQLGVPKNSGLSCWTDSQDILAW